MNARARLLSLIQDNGRARDFDLHRADLAGSDLGHLRADRLNLKAADLRGANLREARLGDCQLERARLDNADFSEATFRMCVLDGAQAANARFDRARLEDSTALGADLSRASLRGAGLTETSFSRAVLRGASLDDAHGDGVEFRGADLGGATLIGVQLDEADFRGADLRGADLTRGRFRGADFRGALLDDARFDGADYEGALFDEGQGPRAGGASNPGEEEATAFNELAVALLREILTVLGSDPATPRGSDAELLERWRHTLGTLVTASDQPPERWKQWLEPLIKMSTGERPLDLKVVLSALSDGPAGLQSVLAIQGALADRLGQLAKRLDAVSDQPPEEWRPWLERLIKMRNEQQPVDLRALLDAYLHG